MKISAEPPSYDSLFGRIRDTHKVSMSTIIDDCSKKLDHFTIEKTFVYLKMV